MAGISMPVVSPRPAPLSLDNVVSSALLMVAIFLCFQPYLVLGPLAAPSQVQPWAALVCWVFVVQRVLVAQLRFNIFHLLMLGFALWFMLYVYDPGQLGIAYYFRRSASFLISWSIILAMQYASPLALWRMLKITLPLWSGFAVLGYASHGLYFTITRKLVPTVVGVAGGRGTSSLAPEATDFGFTMAFMLLIAMVVRRALKHQGIDAERWPIWLALVNIGLSQSGSGFFAAVCIVALWQLTETERSVRGKWARYLLSALAALALVFTVGAMPPTGIRGIDLLLVALRSPQELFNTTFSYRAVHNTVGVIGMFDSDLLGYGAGAFLRVGPHIYADYDLGRLFGLKGWYAANVPETLSVSPVAFFPVILLEYGLPGLVYIALLFRGVGITQIHYKPICLAMLFMTWLQSFPAAYPPFWMIIGIAFNPAFARITPRGERPGAPIEERKR